MSETGFTLGLAFGVAAAHGMMGQVETGFTFTEAGFRPRETYCTWNWTCPHLVSELPAPKIVDCVDKESTTTGAPAAAENAYLARFREPATRIGELLQVDDAAAARMWRESRGANPELTPREFVIVAGMKLREWARVDDARPGLKVRTMTGLLVRSMPHAVVGALYLAARERAAAELESDVRDAHAILQAPDASPRDRAWAVAILDERDET